MLEFQEVSFQYETGDGDHEALSPLSVTLREGERVAVLGSNGAGKSTFFLLANGVLRPHSGTIRLDGEPVGKPHTARRTREIWQRMAGSSPVLWSAHWAGVLAPANDGSGWHLRDHRAAEGQTRVHLASPSDRELEDYIATGEPFEVAGALTIDGLGGAFVSGIEGDHHNVIGLSLPLLRTMLADMGVRWTSLWSSEAA